MAEDNISGALMWLSPKWDAYIWFLLHVGYIIATVPFISAGSEAVIRARML